MRRAALPAGLLVLLDILNDSVLELDVVVPSKRLVWLKPDHAFQAAIDETGKTYPVSRTVRVAGAIGGHFPELTAGMSGKVLLTPQP